MGKKQAFTRMQLAQTALACLSALFILLPLLAMFLKMDAQSIAQVFQKDSLGTVLLNSFQVSALTTLLCLILGYAMAWCMERTAIRGKGLLRVLIALPMLIPSVSIGTGVIILGGNNGILTNLFGIRSGSVYGFSGILLGSLIYSLPVAFLMIDNILKYEDAAPYEAARVLGIPPLRQFCSITLPYLWRPMIGVAFSIFVLSFTDYGVPLMVGGKYRTLPMVMYQEVIGQLNFGKGCVYGSIMLLPAVLAFLVDLSGRNDARSVRISTPFILRPDRRRDALAAVFSYTICMICILPIISFAVLSFVSQYPTDLSLTLSHLLKTLSMGADRYLKNSVVTALLSAGAGTAIACAVAYCAARVGGKSGRYLHLVFLSTGAVPGIVLGLAYVLFFKSTPLYGTLGILVVVNTVHFMASPYLTMYNTFSKVNENLEAVGATMRIGRLRLFLDVLLPMCAGTVREIFSYFFVNSMMTISAVSFLARARTKPLALMITQFETQGQLEAAAVVSLLILLVNLTVKILMERRIAAS